MTTFIDELIDHLLKHKEDLASVEVVLPSRRAGTLFKKKLAKALGSKTTFLPGVRSIEELITEISGLVSASQTQLQFEMYRAYKQIFKDNPDTFLEFLGWAPGVLSDFNEVDRYLLDTDSFFDYLGAIKDINHWAVDPEPSELIKGYLEFWKTIGPFYNAFNKLLESQGMGYQGMQYRKASERVDEYIASTSSRYMFAGFNALNTAEQNIIQAFLEAGHAEIFWDIDAYFFTNANPAPAQFIKGYFKEWPYYKKHTHPRGSNFYLEPKNIKSISVSGIVGQAKYIGQILSEVPQTELEQTAIVLGDEALLLPLLNALPPEISKINITMGLPLAQVPDASFFDAWLLLQQNVKDTSYNSRDVLAFLSQPHVINLLEEDTQRIRKEIETKNLLFVQASQLINISDNKKNAELLFKPWKNNAREGIHTVLQAIKLLKNRLIPDKNWLKLEYLFTFQELFSQLKNLVQDYDYLKDIKSLQYLYRELLSSETLDFRGDPYEGLQIMGVLESRVLDFKNIIVTGLNEEILPSGKSQGSFIPFDLKKANELPTYREKDAIYAYHFFRLLQRAENAYLLYNNSSGGLNSAEKSRFLLQLELENHPEHNLEEISVYASTSMAPNTLKEVQKTPEIVSKLKQLAAHGFSPSALSTYIRNPIDFYYKYVLGIREVDSIEEVVAHNTLGTIVHESLEQLYTPYLGKELNLEAIAAMRAATSDEVARQFQELYNLDNTKTGKNLIIYNVALKFIQNLLYQEELQLKNKHTLRVVECERKLDVPLSEKITPVRLRGTVDRIDVLDGITRIIDYKTGKVMASELKLKDWELLTTDYKKHAKAFQVLCYALMMQKEGNLAQEMEAGIISFKNLSSGFMKFSEKSTEKISPELLTTFEKHLLQLVEEILNIDIPFTEKAVD